MLADATPICFVATADAARARAFYVDVLGLELVEDSPFALVFDAAGTMLRVQKVEAVTPHPYTSLGWKVANMTFAVEALVERGVTFERFPGMTQDALGVWSTPSGAKVAWFKDPDGNLLSLTSDG